MGETSRSNRSLIIYGAGGHGKAVIDLVRAIGSYEIVGLIDDSQPTDSHVFGLPVLGGSQSLDSLIAQGVRLAVNAVGGIGNVSSRTMVFDLLKTAGFGFPTLVHPSAVVEPSAELADGVQVFPLAYVGSASHVGFGCILNTGVIVSHDCVLGDVVNISPGGILAGRVTVGPYAQIGMGATINLDLNIGKRARIGNGATVKADVPEDAVVRAGTIWPLR